MAVDLTIPVFSRKALLYASTNPHPEEFLPEQRAGVPASLQHHSWQWPPMLMFDLGHILGTSPTRRTD